ncbi:acyltransferase family protein [Variovorax sp. J22R24]|uniref:acyltransferase family protein n=1 Tax=Variovorax gracilis TaxID=3053502 RepID=UPI002577F077|nr:acyltransferase family protein [Variovorax sp. J22R24]MDM0104130.1 acyltransferase family protein [Variovorax sp. J22R24]
MTTNRRHDIDALRALAFLLLILYHVGMYYVAGWPWHIKSPHAAEWLRWPMVVVNVWRMDLVFLVSGVAFGFLGRGMAPLGLIRQRALRLLLPLAFGMAVVVPYQAYAQGVANGLVEPGFAAFMTRYLVGGPWPKGAFDGSDFPMTWNHLWYLPYLFTYTAVTVLLMPLMRTAPIQRLRSAFTGLRRWRLLVLPALPLVLFTLVLAPRFPVTHDLIHDGYLHALYFTVFLYGYWMGVDEGIWHELERLRNWALVLAVACIAAFIVLKVTGADAEISARATRVLRAAYLWTAVVAILGFAHRHLNRPWPWLGWANESVYPWYTLHQTLIIAGAVALAPVRLGPVLEPVLLIAITLLGCWALTDGLVRRFRWLRPLFGLKPIGHVGIRTSAPLPKCLRTPGGYGRKVEPRSPGK